MTTRHLLFSVNKKAQQQLLWREEAQDCQGEGCLAMAFLTTIAAVYLLLLLMQLPTMVAIGPDSFESPIAQSQCVNGMFDFLRRRKRQFCCISKENVLLAF